MKKIVAIIGLFSAPYMCASSLTLKNSSSSPVTMNFNYTASGVCFDDSRTVNPGQSIPLDIGGCSPNTVTAVRNGQTLSSVSSLGGKAWDTVVELKSDQQLYATDASGYPIGSSAAKR
jgi:hypothetical protein